MIHSPVYRTWAMHFTGRCEFMMWRWCCVTGSSRAQISHDSNSFSSYGINIWGFKDGPISCDSPEGSSHSESSYQSGDVWERWPVLVNHTHTHVSALPMMNQRSDCVWIQNKQSFFLTFKITKSSYIVTELNQTSGSTFSRAWTEAAANLRTQEVVASYTPHFKAACITSFWKTHLIIY